MINYLVTANGHDFGYFKAETAKAACDLCAQEAGYKDEEDAAGSIGMMTNLAAEADSFINSADSRNTSPELMKAILFIAGGDDGEAVAIWADPSAAQMLAIWENVTNNGLRDSTDFCWGEEGYQWAANARIEG